MIVSEQAIDLKDPEDSVRSENTEPEAGNISRNRLFSRARLSDPGQSDEIHDVRDEAGVMDLQISRNSFPPINKIGASCTDPFQTLPNLAGGDTEILTYHCMSQPEMLML
jgi:hypothetical protein